MHPPPLAPPPAACPKSGSPGHTPAPLRQKSRSNPHSPPAATNPSAIGGPAPSHNPALSPHPATISPGSTAVRTHRDPRSRHPSTRQSRRFHRAAPAAYAPPTKQAAARRPESAIGPPPSIEKSAIRLSFLSTLRLQRQPLTCT